MARNKYVGDYRLLETVDARGRIRVDYEYIGENYVFTAGAAAAAREKRLLLALCAAGWIAWLGAMAYPSLGMRTLFVALPLAFTALPLGMLTSSVFSIPSGEGTMEHRTADKLANAFPPRALFAAALPCAAVAGELALLLSGREGMTAGDAILSLGAAVTAGCAAAAFSRRKRLSVQVSPKQ